MGPHARRHLGGVGSDDAAADDRHLRRWHARDAAEKRAPSAGLRLQQASADLDRHLAGYLAHRHQQGQRAVLGLHCLVPQRDDPSVQQRAEESPRGGEMEVGEEDLPLAQQLVLFGQGLLDLEDHIGAAVHRRCLADHPRPGPAELPIRYPAAGSRPALHQHPVAVLAESAHSRRCDSHPLLAVFDFARHPQDHGLAPRSGPPFGRFRNHMSDPLSKGGEEAGRDCDKESSARGCISASDRPIMRPWATDGVSASGRRRKPPRGRLEPAAQTWHSLVAAGGDPRETGTYWRSTLPSGLSGSLRREGGDSRGRTAWPGGR